MTDQRELDQGCRNKTERCYSPSKEIGGRSKLRQWRGGGAGDRRVLLGRKNGLDLDLGTEGCESEGKRMVPFYCYG